MSSHTETSALRLEESAIPEAKELGNVVLRLEEAAVLAGLGNEIEHGARLPRVKRLLLRVLRLITRQQTSFNLAVVDLLRETSLQLNELGDRLAALEVAPGGTRATLDEVQKSLERTSLDLMELLSKELDTVQGRVGDELRQALADLEGEREVLRSQLGAQQARIDMLLAEARRRLPDPFDEDQLRTFSDQLSQRFDALYADFESVFRGRPEEISAQLQEYLPDVLPLARQELPVVDVGCGRGEWLQLLKEHKIPSYGVDVNQRFVELGSERGLDVRLEDALQHLAELPEGSLAAVTGFHIIEHLEFPTLIELLDASLHALRPGGFILFETPNPTNLSVGAAGFYVDPTHRSPVHPDLAEFLAKSRGFIDVEIRFLHPTPDYELSTLGDVGPDLRRILEHLNRVLFGPQDYAVIAYKLPGRTER